MVHGTCHRHPDLSLKTRFEQIELPAKLLVYFLWSNKSNLNQEILMRIKESYTPCRRGVCDASVAEAFLLWFSLQLTQPKYITSCQKKICPLEGSNICAIEALLSGSGPPPHRRKRNQHLLIFCDSSCDVSAVNC